VKSWILLACALCLLGAASMGPAVTSSVSIRSSGFSPSVDTVSVYDTVKWINQDGTDHTVTSKPGSTEVWDSGDMSPGVSFTHAFNQAGVFHYQCTLSGVQGTIVVISQSPVKSTTWGKLRMLFRGKPGILSGR